MYSSCLRRLVGSSASRTTLSNAQLLITTSNASTGRPRYAPDLWRSILLHEHHAVDPHPEAPQPVTRSAAAILDMDWCHNFADAREESVSRHSQDSFRASAPKASIGVAEMAAALALAGLGTMHVTTITEPPSAVLPTSMQSSAWPSTLTIPEEIRAKVPSLQSPAPAATISIDDTKQPDSAARAELTAQSPAFLTASPRAALEATATSDLTSAPHVPAAQVQVGSQAIPSASAPAALEADYLPAALQQLVPSSMTAYWKDVHEAMLEGRLHATIYVSRSAWSQVAPTIAAMLGADLTGPASQVRFALVPLGEGYAARADAAQGTQTSGGYSGDCLAGVDGPVDDGLAARFGLDVALAACALADWERVRGGVRRLDACPALVVRGGYTGSSRGGEVSPSWSMRQELDAHVRRNLVYGQQQQQLLQRFMREQRPQWQ